MEYIFLVHFFGRPRYTFFGEYNWYLEKFHLIEQFIMLKTLVVPFQRNLRIAVPAGKVPSHSEFPTDSSTSSVFSDSGTCELRYLPEKFHLIPTDSSTSSVFSTERVKCSTFRKSLNFRKVLSSRKWLAQRVANGASARSLH